MKDKRKDSRGRDLFTGECQRKDGKYQYDYKDRDGKIKCVYSWRLIISDPIPKGKRFDKSLREKEDEIKRLLGSYNFEEFNSDMTVLDLVKNYVSKKANITLGTKRCYNYVVKDVENDAFGNRKISEVRVNDAKNWLTKLQLENGKSYNKINIIKSVLKTAFQTAVDDDLIVKNPFNVKLSDIISNDAEKREALTEEEKTAYLEFIKNDKVYAKYYDAIYILFHTGLRISEFCGLTIDDIDLENKQIVVNKQLLLRNNEKMITNTKSKSGNRVLPITDEVCECFENIIKKRKNFKVETIVKDVKGNEYSKFINVTTKNNVMLSNNWNIIFNNLHRKYVKVTKKDFPKVTPHICRHTFCTYCVTSGLKPKTVQYLMGHSNVSITFDIYTHNDMDDIKNEIDKLNK